MQDSTDGGQIDFRFAGTRDAVEQKGAEASAVVGGQNRLAGLALFRREFGGRFRRQVRQMGQRVAPDGLRRNFDQPFWPSDGVPPG